MLEIITKTGISLDLPSDIQIDITIENPFMSADKIPTPYSLSIDLPTTPKNLQAFGRPDIVASVDIIKTLDVNIIFSGITFFSGVLSLGETRYRSISVNIEGVLINGTYDNKLNTFPMKEYSFKFDDVHFDEDLSSLLKEASLGNEEFIVAPIRDSSIEWGEFITYEIGPIPNYLTTGRNYYNVGDNSFLHFNRTGVPYSPNVTPVIKVSHMLDMLCDGLVGDNPYSIGELDKLVIIPKRKPAKFSDVSGLIRNGVNCTLNLSKFLATSSAGDLLKDLLKLICATLIPDGPKFKIVHNKDIINDNVIIDWSARMEKEYTINREDIIRYKWGYKNKKTNDKKADDAYYNDIIPVTSVSAMLDHYSSSTNSTSVKKAYKIEPTGEIYLIDPKDKDLSFSIIDSGIVTQEEDDNFDYDATCSFRAVETNVEKYYIDARPLPVWRHWLIPTIEYTEAAEDEDMYIGIYHGYVPVSENGNTYPFISSHNYDMMGNKLGDLSLSSLKDSHIAVYHNDFANWLEKPKVVLNGKANLDVFDLANFDICRKVHCFGKNFYPRVVTMHIKKNRIEPSDVELIEA